VDGPAPGRPSIANSVTFGHRTGLLSSTSMPRRLEHDRCFEVRRHRATPVVEIATGLEAENVFFCDLPLAKILSG